MGDGLENDERMLEVVTEGLRAGPGTVAWDEAVRVAGAEAGGAAGDEMKVLMGVRRRLEAGRGWREVRAGDAFTHKLMTRLESQPRAGGGAPLTMWIIGLAVLGVVGVAVWGLMGLLGSDGRRGLEIPGAAGGLAGTVTAGGGVAAGSGDRVVSYASPIVAWNFAATWPDQTAVFGDLANRAGAEGWGPVAETADGGKGVASSGAARAGVAAWLDMPLGAMASGVAAQANRTAIEIVLRLPSPGTADGRPGRRRESAVVTHVFLSTAEALDSRLGTSPAGSEWALQLDDDGMRVATGGGEVVAVGGGGGGGVAGGVPTGTVVVLLELSPGGGGQGRSVSVSVAGERVWSGMMGVSDEPVRVGVRFLSRGGGKSPGVGAVSAELPRAVSLRVFESR